MGFDGDASGEIKCSVKNKTTAAPTTAAPTTKVPPPTTAAPTTKAPLPNPMPIRHKNYVTNIVTTLTWKIEFNLKIDTYYGRSTTKWYNFFLINENKKYSNRPMLNGKIGPSTTTFFMHMCGCDNVSLSMLNCSGVNATDVPFLLDQWHKIIMETDSNHNLTLTIDGIVRSSTSFADRQKNNLFCARAGDELSLFMGSGWFSQPVAPGSFIGDFKYNGVAVH